LKSFRTRTVATMLLIVAGTWSICKAQSASASESDTLLFNDGEKLIGHLKGSTDTKVTFKSDMAGEITVEWSKVKELHSGQRFAVIQKGVKLNWSEDESKIPQGVVSVSDDTINLSNGNQAANVPIPVSNTADLIDAATFTKVVIRKPGWFEDWKGSATFGLALVQGTQQSRSYTSAVSLVRSIPTESWMQAFSRNTLSFTSAYGQLTQPGTPAVKTSIFHANAERDRYFTQRLYLFGDTSFDHDYSQGLDLQQTFGGGIGWTLIKGREEEFDVRAQLAYVNQQFFDSTRNKSLLGSIFSEAYNRTFRHNIVFHEDLTTSIAVSNTNASSARGNISLALPVYRRLSVSLTSADTFLNDPSPGFRKNSFQFATGLTYTVR
jgi:putative salt-induced outer membrane protein YdiY